MKRHSKKSSIKNIQTLLKNRNVLYIVLFLSVANLFSYLMLKQLDAVAFFIIIGFLTTYFSKNMIIVMLTSVVSTFLLVQIKLLGNRQEGFEGEEKEAGAEAGAGASEAGASEAGASEAGASEAGAGAGAGEASAGAPPDAVDGGVHISKEQRAKITAMKDTPVATPPKKEKFTQKLNPARYNNDDDDDVKPRHKPKVDYSATLETAYDNLDKLLNSDGIKNMSADTGRLAEKQKLLMGNIEKLTPIMEKASSVLNSMDIGGITGLMGGIQNRLKGFGKKEPVDEAAE